jgi:hypothetical protein
VTDAAPQGYGWVSIVGTVIGMLVVAAVAWRLVQRQEQGDAAFEEKLKADDDRAARGRAEESGAAREGGDARPGDGSSRTP